MRKAMAMLLAAIMLLVSAGVYAEEAAFVMAGYDSESSGHIWDDNMFFRRMEERTGIVFNFKQARDYDVWKTELADMMDSKDGSAMPDVLFKAELTPAETMAYAEAGKLIDLKPYLTEAYAPNLSAILAAHPEYEKAITLPNGMIAALPGINELQNTNAIWINTNWLTSVRMEVPTTAEELTEVLRAFKNSDPNRNGRNDEVPLTFTSLWDLRFLGTAFGLVTNDYHLTVDDAGQVAFMADSAQNRLFIEWLHQLWEEKLIDHNGFATIDTTRAITDSNATITYGVVFGPSALSMVPHEAMSAYRVLMPMTYEGKAEYRDLLGNVVRGTFAITSACKDPAAMMRWVDYLYSREGELLAQAGMEGEEYTMLSDGSWAWIDDTSTVANTVLTDVVIIGGGLMPGLASADLQLRYDDTDTHAAVEQLYQLKQASRMPYPLVYLAPDRQAEVNDLWAQLGPYCETAMVHFITGDEPLNDETWQAFCDGVAQRGRERFVALWQEALN